MSANEYVTNYTEEENVGNKYRIDYRNDINNFISELRRRRIEESVQNAGRFLNNRDEERALLAKALGWPLNDNNIGAPKVQITKVTEETGVCIYRTVFEILNIRYYGLLFLQGTDKKRPLVICQHGGLGTPELCSSLLKVGSENYNDMTQRILKIGINVFAPQMLIWNPKRFDSIPDDDLRRKEVDAQLKELGSSIAALEITLLKKSLDYFCSQPYVDSERIGMVGLSYGGFYTLYMTALDTRIKAAISCSFFNDRSMYPWSDWVWNPGKAFFFDPEVAMLIYPRAICIAVGENDKLFDIKSADGEIERLKEMSYAAYKSVDWFNIAKFNGEHEFITTDDALQWFKDRL